MKTLALVLATLVVLCAGCSPPVPNSVVALNSPAVQPARAEPPAPWQYQDSLNRAVRHVLDTQKAKGDWGYMSERPYDIWLGSMNSLHVWGNASSALCVHGLMLQPPTPELNDAIRKGLAYLCEAPDTPRGTMDTFYNVWAHIYVLETLSVALRDARFADIHSGIRARAQHELRRLIDHQALDGGWAYYDFFQRTNPPSGDMSASFITAAALVALHRARQSGLPVSDRTIELAVNYMHVVQLPSGAYAYGRGDRHYPMTFFNLPRGSLGRSQAGDNALFTWRDVLADDNPRKLGTDRLRAQLDTFFKDHVFIEMGRGRQFPHEAWYATAPYYYYFGHYYASRNVLALPDDIRAGYAQRLAEKVVPGQYDDGSFWDYPLYGYAKAYGTGFGVMILSNLKQASVKSASGR